MRGPIGRKRPRLLPPDSVQDFPEPDAPSGPMDIRGNGRWVFQPNLSGKDLRRASTTIRTLKATAAGPICIQPRLDIQRAPVFKISAANVITSMRIEGQGQPAESPTHSRSRFPARRHSLDAGLAGYDDRTAADPTQAP